MRIIIYLFVLFLFIGNIQAQDQYYYTGKKDSDSFINHFKIGAGLSVFSIRAGEENLNIESLMPSDNNGSTVFGGQMGGGHPGYHVQFTAYLDWQENYRIPIGISQNFMSSANTRPASSQGILTRYNHNIDLIKLNAGFHVALFDFPSSEAKVYIGSELIYSFIINSNYSERFDFLAAGEDDVDLAKMSKENATRIGGLLRLGVEGHLHKRMYINVGLGMGCLNVFGRDDERGELFTFTNTIEIQESYVYFIDFSLILQYHL